MAPISHFASLGSISVGVIDKLVNYGANINAANNDTPLHYAGKFGHKKAAHFIYAKSNNVMDQLAAKDESENGEPEKKKQRLRYVKQLKNCLFT